MGPQSSSIRYLIFASLSLSSCLHAVALFVFLKPVDVLQVALEIVHCFCKCGVLLDGRRGKFRLQSWD